MPKPLLIDQEGLFDPDVGLMNQALRPKNAAFRCVKLDHFSGRSSNAKMADTGQTGTTCAAVDTFDGVDIEHLFGLKPVVILLRMDTIDRARVHASRVFGSRCRVRR